jgi:hypothetical protein
MKPIQFADLSKLIGENIYSTHEAAKLVGVGVENTPAATQIPPVMATSKSSSSG